MDAAAATEGFFHAMGVIMTSTVVGGAIDFLIGKSKQKKINSWLEESWYRFENIDWHNFSKREIEGYINLSDRLFGIKLFSKRRFFSVLTVLVITTLIPLLKFYFSDFVGDFIEIGHYRWLKISVTMLSYCAAFALSISFTRWASSKLKKIIGISFLGNIFSFISVFFITLATSTLTTKVIFNIIYLISDTIMIQIQSGWISRIEGYIYPVQATFHHIIDDISNSEYWNPLYPFLMLQSFYHECGNTWSHGSGCIEAADQTLFYSGHIFRLFIISTFFLSLLFRWIFRKPFSLILARFIESEKPPFATLFGATGSTVALVAQLVAAFK
ncbi:hypothetical protein SAMN05216303_11417 [Rhodoferax sp. OV413]|uniref:hypothetical protein n=1 Tax=Rhodoferax sp. OV413 TaxID=1855285 RepID=UPI00088592DC|nr:hypothetical protein [Rhodoferax sp. OV413]SDP94272.1 hypothetical protein SAMN05216303_11417 [Rhodoferax sp. OV413]